MNIKERPLGHLANFNIKSAQSPANWETGHLVLAKINAA